ncbi:MAG: hypothetical protein U5L75_02380 [Candidatus Campbellbacteria bacterium]|nr:hypothetical protein [Candidatus Campbellbacteria bacterium]
MNSFVAKKIGEVCAFANVANETITRAESALREVYGESFEETRDTFRDVHDELIALSEREGLKDAVSDKCSKTSDKLRQMRETYLTSEEDWQDPVEVLEWSSFFYGAGYAHSELVQGASEELEIESLSELAEGSSKLHHDLLHHAVDYLRDDGKKRAQE